MKEYVDYYNKDRCHLSLERNSPLGREIQERPTELHPSVQYQSWVDCSIVMSENRQHNNSNICFPGFCEDSVLLGRSAFRSQKSINFPFVSCLSSQINSEYLKFIPGTMTKVDHFSP
jgi:hypothetical protein